MPPEPLYQADELRPAYQLRYSWTGWPSSAPFPPDFLTEALPDIVPEWEGDGIRVLESAQGADRIQITSSTLPRVAPVTLAARVKGRIQHHARLRGTPIDFSRKVSVRSLGDPTRAEVEAYIRNQVAGEEVLDDQLRAFLAQFTVVDREVDLAQATETRSGQYWYNLHLVLVMHQRHQLEDARRLTHVRDQVLKVCATKGYAVSTLAVMPDHLHLALRGPLAQSPEAIALSLLNNLAYSVGQEAWWQAGYYAGTFGEYSTAAVRPKGGDR